LETPHGSLRSFAAIACGCWTAPGHRSIAEIRRDSGRYAFSFDLAEAEKTFVKPALIITGRQDVTVGYRDAWAILESDPRATFAAMDRADHVWPVETTDLLAALIDDWLKRIAERGR
jgi:pimeloyl-ACP methyl ester carboxylesterase